MRLLTAVVAALAVALTAFGVAYAKDHIGGHAGLSESAVTSDTQQVSKRVIVVMRDQVAAQPATRKHIRARIRAEAGDDTSVISQVQRSGGHVYQRYHGLNAFAASVSDGERSTLKSNSAVADVVPDQVVQLPAPINAPASAGSSSGNGAAPNSSPQTGVCPTDPSKPLLEPEALQTTHTAYTDSTTPQAQSLATGQGVKVAFFADGLDINNPDFVRPDGEHVFIDYKDFSGDGLGAPTGAAEAFGDASSIAAQGRQVYDISNFMNPAHPLPPGCNITVRGVAPGASLIGMKVFGNANSSFNSTILQGLDYALTTDHADVFSESFGGYPIPDTTQDLTRQFNEQAVAAGATVVESSGDSGVEASPSSAASDPAVIDAGASTTFRNYAQGTQYGFQMSNGSWLSDNISSIESAGFTQGGRTVDLVAPGEANWALCSANTAIYEECADFKGAPTNLQSFGGTSESAPLIAGGAALVIEAYRAAHNGATPSPALVREMLTSTASDLGEPTQEEGAGELNSLAAVQAAESIHDQNGSPAAVGHGLLVSPNQTLVEGDAGSSSNSAFKVTNVGSTSEIVHAHARAITSTLANQTGSVTLNPSSPTFVDQFGSSRPYEVATFTVPNGADRLVTFDSWNGPNARVGMTLLEPDGTFAAYTRPQGDGDHGEVDVAHPPAGTWKALIFIRDGTFSGNVQWQATSQAFGAVDTVTPSSLTLSPGQTSTVHLRTTLPAGAGDTAHDLVLDNSSGGSTIVPVVLRSLVPVTNHGGTFTGDLIGGNGRNGAFQPGQIDTYEFDVPRNRDSLTVSLSIPNDGNTDIFGTLVDPGGHALAMQSTERQAANGKASFVDSLQATHLTPVAGRWRFVIDVTNQLGAASLSVPYTGHVSFDAPAVTTKKLPQSLATVLPKGQPTTATIKVSNPGPAPEDLFLDPRQDKQQSFSLLALTPDSNLPLPLPAGTTPPLFLIPGQTNGLDVAAQATEPVAFDFGFGDPDIASIGQGNTASGTYSAPEVTPGVWSVAPTAVGPFTGPAPKGTVSVGMVAHTKGFDEDVSSSTGDVWEDVVDPNAPGFALKNVAPGGKGKMTVTITPSGRKGRVVHGTIYVDDFSNLLDFGNEVVAIPYEYTVG